MLELVTCDAGVVTCNAGVVTFNAGVVLCNAGVVTCNAGVVTCNAMQCSRLLWYFSLSHQSDPLQIIYCQIMIDGHTTRICPKCPGYALVSC